MNRFWTRYLPGFIREKIEGRLQLQEVLGNTGWMMGDQVLRQVVKLLVGIWLARYLGPHLFGELSYAVALVMIVSPIALLAMDEIAIRRLVQDPACRDKVLGSAFVMMAIGGVLAFGVAMASIHVVRPDDSLSHWLVGILAFGSIVQAFMAIEFWFESQMQWKYAVFGKTTAFLLLNFVKIGLILVEAPLIAFAWAGLAEIAVGSLGLVLVYQRRGFSLWKWSFSRETAKGLLRDGWPIIISTLLTMTYLRIDQVMLGSLAGNAELGQYSVAVRISEAWYFIPSVICNATFPAIMKAEIESEELFYAHMQRLYRLMAFMAYAVAIPVAFFAGDIIHLLFSEAYADAGPLLAVLIWTGLFTSLGTARNVFIIARNWTRVNLISIALGCVLNILLNAVMIPRFGAMGAVVATFISYWFAIHGACLFLKPLRKTGWMMSKAMLYPKIW